MKLGHKNVDLINLLRQTVIIIQILPIVFEVASKIGLIFIGSVVHDKFIYKSSYNSDKFQFLSLKIYRENFINILQLFLR